MLRGEEMQENNPAVFPQNPKVSLNIPRRHTKYIIFILLSSLPLLCFMISYETFLEKNLIELIKISIPPSDDVLLDWPLPDHLIDNLTWELSRSLIFLSLMYIPLSILELISMVITTDLASKIYKEEEPISLRDFVAHYKSRGRLSGIFATFMYVLFLSTCGFLGLLCFTMALSYTKLESFFTIIVYGLAYPLVLLGLLVKYLEFSVVWNLSLVVSVLEAEYGTGAFALSFHFSERYIKRGMYLMLVFLLVVVGLRIPCFYVDDGWVGLVARTSLLWVADLVQWVAFMAYYHECKSRVLKRKIDPGLSKGLIAHIA